MLSNRVESIAAAGDQLVWVALMSCVEDQLIAWSIEDVMQGERQLNGAEIPAEMAANLGDDFNDPLADLLGQLLELRPIEFADVEGRVDLVE